MESLVFLLCVSEKKTWVELLLLRTHFNSHNIIKKAAEAKGRREISTIRKLMRCYLSLSKKKKPLKFELIIWECIDVRFAPLLHLNRTEELSDETPYFRKATISFKWRLKENNSGCWAAVLTNQGVIVPKFHQCHLRCKFSTWPWPPISWVVLKAMCWPACVRLYLSSFFPLAVKFN